MKAGDRPCVPNGQAPLDQALVELELQCAQVGCASAHVTSQGQSAGGMKQASNANLAACDANKSTSLNEW
jgi:hypothetical protein